MESIQETPKIIMATVYLKTQSGRSLLGGKRAAPIDPAPYLPSSETVEKAISGLQRLGFRVEAQGVTLSISGSPALFEQNCDVKISLVEEMLNASLQSHNRKRFVFKSSKPLMQIMELRDVIDGIVLAVPGIALQVQ